MKYAISGQFDYYDQKQNKVLYVNMEYMNLLSPIAPSLVFARETCTPYLLARTRQMLLRGFFIIVARTPIRTPAFLARLYQCC